MKLLKSASTVSALTLLSRISGFMRDVVIARIFGASIWTDAFFVAFKIPNFMRRLFAEGSFSLAFIPVLNEVKAEGDPVRLKAMIDHVAGALLAVLVLVLAVLELAAPGVIHVFAFGFSDQPAVFDASVDMLRITLPYLLLISLVAFCGGVLNTHDRFAIPAVTPVLLNVSLIACVLWLHRDLAVPEQSLAWGVLLAGVLQLLLQWPALARLGLLPRPRLDWHNSEVRKIVRLMGPTLVGSSVAQINLLVDTVIATALPLVGSVSFLYFADRLLEFPLAVFGIAISTVILPRLSLQHASLEKQGFQDTIAWALSLATALAIPCAVGLLLLAQPIMYTLFEYGAFDASNTHNSAVALMVYALALPAFVLNKVLLPVFYARKDTRTPVRVAVIVMLANMLLNGLFIWALWLLQVQALHAGLALASAVAGWLQLLLLSRHLQRNKTVHFAALPWHKLYKVLLASLLMGGVLYLSNHHLLAWVDLHWHQRVLNLSALIVAGAAVYFAALHLLRVRLVRN